jgi:hypothetical protein
LYFQKFGFESIHRRLKFCNPFFSSLTLRMLSLHFSTDPADLIRSPIVGLLEGLLELLNAASLGGGRLFLELG